MQATCFKIPADSVAPRKLPAHLIEIDRGQWSLWRCLGLRGAGFPAKLLFKLSSSLCAAAADEYLQAEDQVEQATQAALECIREKLEKTPEDRYPLIAAIQQLKKGKLPDGLTGRQLTRPTLQALQEARVRETSALADFQNAFSAAASELALGIRDIAQMESFQEAIIWQNRRAFHTGVAAFLRHLSNGAKRNSKQRQYEQLIANYVQRYCAKNDTIGFFGPVGWAEFQGEGSAITTTVGSNLLAERKVYFEGWCIDALVETLNARGLRRWVAPRLNPTLRVAGRALLRPFAGPLLLSETDAALLVACDGERTAKQLTTAFNQASPTQPISEAEVLERLESFRADGFIAWDLEVPIEPYPERSLGVLLSQIGDAEVKEWAFSCLRKLEDGRRAVANSAGNAAKLDQALADLELAFTSVTGRAPTKSAGKTYAGRTLVYEDCRRNIEVAIGEGILQSLAAPLSLLLTSARWLSFELAKAFKHSCREIYIDLARTTGGQKVDFSRFWQTTQPILFNDRGRLLNPILASFHERWEEVLKCDYETRAADFSVEQIRPRVEEVFDAPAPGWAYARYHSPDLLFSAASLEAIAAGEFEVVLGELHVAANTLGWPLFLEQHRSPEDLFAALEQDIPETRLVPVIPKQMFGSVARVLPALISPRDYRLELSPGPTNSPKSKLLPISDLIVEDGAGGLSVKSRDGSLRFDIVEAFADLLTTVVTNEFKILKPAPHSPRVRFDRLVVCRETWQFRSEDITFALKNDESARFVAARRWAREWELPRFVFVKVPVEQKPFFVDFRSPVLVEILAKMVRRTSDSSQSDSLISCSEMLPTLNHAWLPDAAGNSYACELRMVALDNLVSSSVPAAGGVARGKVTGQASANEGSGLI